MNRQTAAWVRKAEEDILGARGMAVKKPPLRNLACFHCQQAVEKYLKARLQSLAVVVPKTHDLLDLLNLLVQHDATLAALRRGLDTLTQYAVDYRYPGKSATTRQMRSALRIAEHVRTELRARLGLRE